MRPATAPRDHRSDTRLLAVDRRSGALRDLGITDLATLLRPGDLLIVNDAATLPASLHARLVTPDHDHDTDRDHHRNTDLDHDHNTERHHDSHRDHNTDHDHDSHRRRQHDLPRAHELELRLTGGLDGELARAALLGAGDWRSPTEHRPPPPALRVGDILRLLPPGPALEDMSPMTATVAAIDPRAPRLLTLRFDRSGADLWAALYRLGRPVQYSYLGAALPLWSVQTAFAGRPWAAEMPSAGRPLALSTLLDLRRRGVEICALTHAAGLSSTGDPALDALLPLPERYDLPAHTVAAITRTHARGGRVIAAGTTVVRALEGCLAERGALHAGPGETSLLLHAGFVPRVVDGLLTGMHDPSESHFHLLRAFASEPVLMAAWSHASAAGYQQHEFGDATLLVPDLPLT